MKQKNIAVVFVALAVLGTAGVYLVMRKARTETSFAPVEVDVEQKTLTTDSSQKEEANARKELLDTAFRNDEYGYEIKYPSLLFMVNDTRPSDVGFTKVYRSGGMANPVYGITDFYVTASPYNKSIESLIPEIGHGYDNKSGFLVYLNDGLVNPTKAVRYEFSGTQKQSPGGYGYVIVKNNMRYDAAFFYDEMTVYDGKANKIRDMYDPLGDSIMMTFKFVSK